MDGVAHHQSPASYPLSITSGGGSTTQQSATPPAFALGAQPEDSSGAAIRAGNPDSLSEQPRVAAAGLLLTRAESSEGTAQTLQAASSEAGPVAGGRSIQAQDAMARPAARHGQLPAADGMQRSSCVPPEQLDGSAATQWPSSDGHPSSHLGKLHSKDCTQAPRNVVLEIDGWATGKLCMEPAPQQGGRLLLHLAGQSLAQDASSLLQPGPSASDAATCQLSGDPCLAGMSCRQATAGTCLLQVGGAKFQSGIPTHSSPGGLICGTASGLSCCPESSRLPHSWHLVSANWLQ